MTSASTLRHSAEPVTDADRWLRARTIATHLHIRVHRPPQGRRGHSPRPSSTKMLDAGRVQTHRRRCVPPEDRTTFDVSLWGYFLRSWWVRSCWSPPGRHRDRCNVADISSSRVTVTDSCVHADGLRRARHRAQCATLKHVFVIASTAAETGAGFREISTAGLQNLYARPRRGLGHLLGEHCPTPPRAYRYARVECEVYFWIPPAACRYRASVSSTCGRQLGARYKGVRT